MLLEINELEQYAHKINIKIHETVQWNMKKPIGNDEL